MIAIPQIEGAKIAIAAAALAIAAALGAWACHAFYAPRLELARTNLGTCTTNAAALETSLGKQNEAVIDLKAKAAQRERDAKAAVAAAAPKAESEYHKASAVMTLRPPAGKDECKAAREAFDDELKEERGRS